MLLLKSGDLYWDGTTFQPDYRKAILYGSFSVACKDIPAASKARSDVKAVAPTDQQWPVPNPINGGF